MIPIRDYDTHEVLPGIIIGDCGKKAGMDGIDNGFILFKDHRFSYDCMLDKFSSINEDGKFKSSVKNKEKRLGVTMAALIGGRCCIISGAEQNMKNGLTIALRFSAVRKQFGVGDTEYSVLDYPLQQYRLIPHLSKVWGLRAISLYLATCIPSIREKIDENPDNQEIAEFHAILSACKGVAAWYGISCLQECREATGGLGYSAYSALSRIKNNADLAATWEGDNSVLIQQTGKFILKQFQRIFKGAHVDLKSFSWVQIDYEKILNYRAKFENSDQLENPESIKDLLEFRLNYTLHQVILKLQESSANSKDMFDAWNKSQVFYIQELAKTYAEYIIIREYLLFVQDLESKCQKTGGILRKLFNLYSVGVIERYMASFQEFAFTPHQGKIVRDSITRLCEELANYSVQLIDAIATPDNMNGSVLGAADGQIYKRMIEQVEKAPNCYGKPSWLPVLQEFKNRHK